MIDLKIDTTEKTDTDALNMAIINALPQDKLLAMKKFTATLRKKFPHMKPDRVKRKVAEEFHIKLI